MPNLDDIMEIEHCKVKATVKPKHITTVPVLVDPSGLFHLSVCRFSTEVILPSPQKHCVTEESTTFHEVEYGSDGQKGFTAVTRSRVN